MMKVFFDFLVWGTLLAESVLAETSLYERIISGSKSCLIQEVRSSGLYLPTGVGGDNGLLHILITPLKTSEKEISELKTARTYAISYSGFYWYQKVGASIQYSQDQLINSVTKLPSSFKFRYWRWTPEQSVEGKLILPSGVPFVKFTQDELCEKIVDRLGNVTFKCKMSDPYEIAIQNPLTHGNAVMFLNQETGEASQIKFDTIRVSECLSGHVQ